MIKELVIIAPDRVGLLADISYVLAKEKINIDHVDVNLFGDKSVIRLGIISAKYESANVALAKNKFEVLPAKSLVIRLDDKPGALAEMTRKLADANINIENVHVLGKDAGSVYDSITVDKPDLAKKILETSIVHSD